VSAPDTAYSISKVPTPQSEPVPGKRELVLEMLSFLIEEFNCNHQADLTDAQGRVQIYERETEMKAINAFIQENMKKAKPALMYLCGHPGTGKTSTLNFVLSNLVSGSVEANLLRKLKVDMYNAMSFKDCKSFCFQLLTDLSPRMTGEDCSKLRKSDFDDDELGNKVAKMFASRPAETKILVIDEIDAFEAHQQTFLALTKAILT
jgi:Cdc6-like AAA superfamily ATPase